jgi:two-component system OmpR family response regulator
MTRVPGAEPDWSRKTVFSTGEAAQVCRVSQQTIIRCFDSGRLQGFRVPGSKFRRIPRDELIRFMRANSMPVSVIEGSVRRVLVVHAPGSPVGALAAALERVDRVELETVTSGFDAGWLLAHQRPQLLVIEAGTDACTPKGVRDRLDASGAVELPRIAVVDPADGLGDIDTSGSEWRVGPGSADAGAVALALLEAYEAADGGASRG